MRVAVWTVRDEPEAAQDDELLLLAQYLNSLTDCDDLSKRDHSKWRDDARRGGGR
jgi:hypothetical protein